MPTKYVREDNRKHRYSSRACTYYIKRISAPMDDDFKEYKSIRTMAEELKLSDPAIRKFIKSPNETEYLRSKQTGVLYLIKKPQREIVCTARCIEESVEDRIAYQSFTSYYQLSKRFRISTSTICKLRKETPLREEAKGFVYDEFKRRFILTFYK